MEQTIFDVADWFLSQAALSHKKVQKLCYYAESWCETFLGQPIATDAFFEARVHGPINSKLFEKYHSFGWRSIKQIEERPKFPAEKEEVLRDVWESYKNLTGTQLENLACKEDPWLKQRIGLSKFEYSNNIIQIQDMIEYYSSILEPILDEKVGEIDEYIPVETPTLCDMDTTVENFKNGRVSQPIELSRV